MEDSIRASFKTASIIEGDEMNLKRLDKSEPLVWLKLG